jgi:hypothetical protein
MGALMNAPSKAQVATNWVEKVNPWVALLGIGGLFPLVGWIWNAVNPIGALDLTVRVENESFIALPSDVHSVPLSLVYGDRHFRSALVFDAIIENTGSRSIGAVGRWKITLRHPDGLQLLQLSSAESVPATISEDVSLSQSDDSVVFDMGILNPGDEVRVKLMAIEQANEFQRPIAADISRIEGLSHVAVERGSALEAAHSRIADRIILPTLVISLLVIIVSVVREQMRKDESARMGWKEYVFFALLPLPLATLFLAWISSWALAWLGVLAIQTG